MDKNKFSLSQLNDEGYTGPIDVLSAEEARFGRESFYKSIGQNESNPGPSSVKTGGFNLKHKWAHDISIDNKILDYVELALGPNIVLWATVFWYKEPHNTKYIPWHQDASYWPMEPRINLTAWIALGPTFKENGCLRIIPGSHKNWLDDEYRELDEHSSFSKGLDPEQVNESKAIDFEMDPGQVVFFSEATLHGSNANTSDIPRLGYSLRFTTPEVKFDELGIKEQRLDYLTRTILVRGIDEYHHNDSLSYSPDFT